MPCRKGGGKRLCTAKGRLLCLSGLVVWIPQHYYRLFFFCPCFLSSASLCQIKVTIEVTHLIARYHNRFRLLEHAEEQGSTVCFKPGVP
jgi:hypothetical protein